jgi:hypothetical protein
MHAHNLYACCGDALCSEGVCTVFPGSYSIVRQSLDSKAKIANNIPVHHGFNLEQFFHRGLAVRLQFEGVQLNHRVK